MSIYLCNIYSDVLVHHQASYALSPILIVIETGVRGTFGDVDVLLSDGKRRPLLDTK